MRIFFLVIAVLFFALSCEKKIDFKLNSTEPKLVVEATIENGGLPSVYLTRSVGYFSHITTDLIRTGFVHGAEVYISNGVRTNKLKEYAVPVSTGDSIYYYSTDFSNPAIVFYGQLNTTYTLRIVAEGKEYTATTKIPSITKHIDSLWSQPAPPGNDSNEVTVMIRVTDPPGYGDYIRYFTKRNNEPFYPGVNSVFDDQVIDGTTYTLQVERGWDRNISPSDRTSFFLKGDTVTFKLSNIDKATFDFWRTMEYSYASVGNPFSTPTKVLSNISGNALGYFGGYASQFKTVIIPH